MAEATVEPAAKPRRKPTAAEIQAALELTVEQLNERIADLEQRLGLDTDRPARTPRNVVEAIIEVMRLVKAVGKDGRNEQQNFNFRGIDGVLNKVGPAMREVGLLCTPGPQTIDTSDVEVGRNRTKMAHQLLHITYVFHYSDADGHITTLEVPVKGESMDAGDKSVSKAFSVAYRTCLIQTLSLPTTEADPDEHVYQRSDALPGLDPDAVVVKLNALKEQHADDAEALANALIEIGDSYGVDRLSTIELPNPKGEMVRGDLFFRQAIAHFKDKARQDAEEKPPATEAEAAQQTAEGSQESAPDPEAAARAEAEAKAHSEQRSAEAAADTAANVAAAQTPRDKMIQLSREEAATYARLLDLKPADFLAPLYEQFKVTMFDQVPPAAAGKWLVEQRPRIIEVLRAARRTGEADSLERAGTTWPARVEDLFGREPERASS